MTRMLKQIVKDKKLFSNAVNSKIVLIKKGQEKYFHKSINIVKNSQVTEYAQKSYQEIIEIIQKELIGKQIQLPEFKISRDIIGPMNSRIRTINHMIQNNSQKDKKVQLQVTYDYQLSPYLSTIKFSNPVEGFDFKYQKSNRLVTVYFLLKAGQKTELRINHNVELKGVIERQPEDTRGDYLKATIVIVQDVESKAETVYRIEGELYKILIFDDTLCFFNLAASTITFGLLYAQMAVWGNTDQYFI